MAERQRTSREGTEERDLLPRIYCYYPEGEKHSSGQRRCIRGVRVYPMRRPLCIRNTWTRACNVDGCIRKLDVPRLLATAVCPPVPPKSACITLCVIEQRRRTLLYILTRLSRYYSRDTSAKRWPVEKPTSTDYYFEGEKDEKTGQTRGFYSSDCFIASWCIWRSNS